MIKDYYTFDFKSYSSLLTQPECVLMDNQEVLYQFNRNQDETVYFSLCNYKDKKYLDLRVFFQPKDSEDMKPTRKGLTLGVEYLSELKKGISICEKQLQSLKTES